MQPISLEKKHENLKAVVRNWEILAAIELKMTCSDNESEQEHVRHFLYKTRKFLDVSRRSPLKQRQRNVRKKCAASAKVFFANKIYWFFLAVFVAVAA